VIHASWKSKCRQNENSKITCPAEIKPSWNHFLAPWDPLSVDSRMISWFIQRLFVRSLFKYDLPLLTCLTSLPVYAGTENFYCSSSAIIIISMLLQTSARIWAAPVSAAVVSMVARESDSRPSQSRLSSRME